jgi:hypothetical protein
MERASENSMVGAIAAAVQASFVDDLDGDGFIDIDEIDLTEFERALGEIGNKPVDESVAEEVAGLVDGKVREPQDP